MKTDICTSMITSRSVLLTMRNVSYTSGRENQNTHFVFSDFFPQNSDVCEIMGEMFVERNRPQVAM